MIVRGQDCLQGAAPPLPPPDEPEQEYSASQKEAIFIQRMNESVKVPLPSARSRTAPLPANEKFHCGAACLLVSCQDDQHALWACGLHAQREGGINGHNHAARNREEG